MEDWLKHLLPEQLAWREKQILKGRDPDPYIKKKLREAGVLGPEASEKDYDTEHESSDPTLH